MNKKELIEVIADHAQITKKAAEVALNTVIEKIKESVRDGEKVTLAGFGTFERRERAARTGINPATGEKINIKSSRVPAFKAAKGFKEFVKQ